MKTDTVFFLIVAMVGCLSGLYAVTIGVNPVHGLMLYVSGVATTSALWSIHPGMQPRREP